MTSSQSAVIGFQLGVELDNGQSFTLEYIMPKFEVGQCRWRPFNVRNFPGGLAACVLRGVVSEGCRVVAAMGVVKVQMRENRAAHMRVPDAAKGY